MTVTVEPRRVQYTATGVTPGPFPVPFQFFELEVHLGVDLVDPSDYTIAQSSAGSIGSVTFNDAPTGLVTIASKTRFIQGTDYVENSDFPAETHEAALDRLTMGLQDLEFGLQRAITVPVTTDGAELDPASNPGSFVYVNADGEFELTPNPAFETAAALTTANAAAAAAAQEAAEIARAAAELAAAQAGVPIGLSCDFNGTVAPSKWVFEFGQVLSRTTYAALFAVMGTTFNTGGEAGTEFRMPDSRGRASVGKDDMGGSSANRLTALTGGINGDTLGAVGGVESHVLTQAQLPAATLVTTITDPGHTHTTTRGGGQTGVQAGVTQGGIATNAADVTSSNTTGITASTALGGTNTAHNNVQPSIVKNKICFAGV